MAVHWNPTTKYKPRNVEEQIMIDAAHFPRTPTGAPRMKCRKCKKRIRGAGHVNEAGNCTNGK